MRRTLWIIGVIAAGPCALAGGLDGRIFLPTPETIGIWEFNELADPTLASGTRIPDLSGRGLEAVVEANSGQLEVGQGDPAYDNPATGFTNEEVRHVLEDRHPHIVVPDPDAFEFDETQDFSIELYIHREPPEGAANWGILAGTWHTRNLIDDTKIPDAEGAWYGFGLFRYATCGLFPTGCWSWIFSPVKDDQPVFIGQDPWPEIVLQPWFEIAEGRHYVVLAVDRTARTMVGYLDGVEVTRYDNLDPTWSFTSPEGRDPALFRLFAGEDDASRNAYRQAPAGTHIDAVRVVRKALSASEVLEVHDAILAGEPHPLSAWIQAILLAQAVDLVPDQCVLLDGSGSLPGTDRTIVSYEWKIGDGPFEAGGATREVSFPNESPPGGIPVTLRVTNDLTQTDTDTVALAVRNPEPVADIEVRWEDETLPGDPILIARGETVELSGEGSFTPFPPDAFRCPLDAQDPLEPPDIAAYSWDLDGDGGEDATGATPPALDLAAPGERPITLRVTDEAGAEGAATRTLLVTDPRGNADVFEATGATILHLEFNDLEEPGISILDGDMSEDLSPNGLDMTFRDPTGAGLQAERGALQLAPDNGAAAYVGAGDGPRGVIEDDGDAFEFDETEDFTFEIYVKPGPGNAPAWGDIAGTFRARVLGNEDDPRYGWGIIKNDTPESYRWILCYGTIDEHGVWFNLPEGVYSYVCCVVDRTEGTSTVYVNGVLAGRSRDVDPSWSFVTPEGLPHARFLLFTREQTQDEFHNIVPGCAVDAIRLQDVAVTAEEVAATWERIRRGGGGEARPAFVRGDADGNGRYMIGDGIQILERLFAGRAAFSSGCDKAGDVDDDGALTIGDAIRLFNFLFAGGQAPEPPYPTCGADPTGDGLTCEGPVPACP